jgi:hypothetical protein
VAVTLDQTLGTQKAHIATVLNLTTGATIAAGGRVVYVAAYFNSGGGTTLTGSGSGLSWAQDHFVSTGNLRIGIYSAACPSGLASGSTLTATANGANHDMMGSAISLLGVDTVSPVVAFNGGTGATAAWTSSSIAALAGNAIVGGSFCDGLVGTSTASGSNTEFSDQNDATQNESQTGVYNLTTAASDTATGTWSGAVTWVALGVAYLAAAGGAPFSTSPFQAIPFMGGSR